MPSLFASIRDRDAWRLHGRPLRPAPCHASARPDRIPRLGNRTPTDAHAKNRKALKQDHQGLRPRCNEGRPLRWWRPGTRRHAERVEDLRVSLHIARDPRAVQRQARLLPGDDTRQGQGRARTARGHGARRLRPCERTTRRTRERRSDARERGGALAHALPLRWLAHGTP